MKNKDGFKTVMLLASDIFHRDVEPSVIQAYWNIFAAYTDKQFADAMAAHLCTGKFFPVPADLINLIDGTSQANAQEAWGEVLKQLRDSANTTFDKPTARAVAAIGGAEYLGTMTYKDLEFKKRDFVAVYESDTAGEPVAITNGQSQIGMVNDLVKKVTDDSTRNSDGEDDSGS